MFLDELEELLCVVALSDEFVCGVVCEIATGSTKDGNGLITAGCIFVDKVVDENIFVLKLVVDGGRDLSGELVGSLIKRLAEAFWNVL